MGRRRLLPNINSMLLRLHLPSSRSNVNDDVNDDGVRTNAGVHTTTKASKKRQQQQHVGDEEASHSSAGSSSSTHHQHHHHLFSWPSLKRRLAHHKEEQQQREELEHAADVDDRIVDGVLVDIVSVPSEAALPRSATSVLQRNSSGSSNNGSVSFGNCEIRTYPQVLGDHPCCSDGCPIQLGWSYTKETTFKVDDYESLVRDRGHCGDQQAKRRVLPHELRLTPRERRSILIHAKQQQELSSSCSSNSTAGASSSADESKSEDAGDHDNHDNDSHDRGHHHHDQKDRRNNCLECSVDCLATSSTTSTTTATSFEQHERELSRECRRLQRGNSNVNVKASRKRNLRNQQAFFGSIHTISIASVGVGSCNNNTAAATCIAQTIVTTTTAEAATITTPL